MISESFMKKILFIFLGIVISHCALAQGLSTNGQITTNGSVYVNSNGAVGSTTGVNKNGQIVVAAVLPTVVTTDISALTGSGATSGATITYSGSATVIAKGLCWDIATHPTVALSTKTTETADITSFSSNMTGLTAITKYYMRAYITTSDGTAYGDEIVFWTIVPGNAFQGGTVGFVFNSTWPGYNKNIQQAYIVKVLSTSNSDKWSVTTTSLLTSVNNGAGPANTAAIVADQGAGSYGAQKCNDYSVVDATDGKTYADWFLPSKGDFATITGLRSTLSMTDYASQYMTSSADIATGFWWWRGDTNKFYDTGTGGQTSATWRTVAFRISSAL
jgi:hypothetical protein